MYKEAEQVLLFVPALYDIPMQRSEKKTDLP